MDFPVNEHAAPYYYRNSMSRRKVLFLASPFPACDSCVVALKCARKIMKRFLTTLLIGSTVCVRVNGQTNSTVSSAASTQTEIIVCIRHGEKPAAALGQLNCRGLNRALALPAVLLGKYGSPQFIFAPNPSDKVDQKENSVGYFYVRPLATIEPTAIRCGLPVDTEFGFSEIDRLEHQLGKPPYHSATIFVVWEHVVLSEFARNIIKTYGGDPSLVPSWPHKDYDTIFVFKITRSEGQKSITFTVDHENLNNLSDTCP
ncbi:MAG TPA: hypothetical protein VNL17_15815 [Verrucomicrobiae bacterium]|nr:hypothetical protein [Verrucomicrobiae bacterium]